MDEILKRKINFAVSQLEEHISMSEVLVKKCAVQEPDYVELCAVGSILQAYYIWNRKHSFADYKRY